MSSLGTILSLKDSVPQAYQSLFLCKFTFPTGDTFYCCSEQDDIRGHLGILLYNGIEYQTRVINVAFQAASAMSSTGIDNFPEVTIDLADGDGELFIAYESTFGFKGATLTIDFVYRDVVTGLFSSDYYRQFVGICDPSTGTERVTGNDQFGFPVEMDTTRSVHAISSYNLFRKLLPNVPDQVRCPKRFPLTSAERLFVASNPFPIIDLWCRYSPDQTSGLGNLDSSGQPYTSCDFSKTNCQQRGMYKTDSSSRTTADFLGNTYNTPAEWRSKSYLQGKTITGTNNANLAQFNEHYPEIFGAGWSDGLVIALSGDGNAMRAEVAVMVGWNGSNDANDGETVGITKVEVNGILVPRHGDAGSDILFNWRVSGGGTNQGAFTGGPGFADSNGVALGDPHGSICKIEVIVWNELAQSNTVPSIRILVGDSGSKSGASGRVLPVYGADWGFALHRTDNPAWVFMELFRRAGIQIKTVFNIQSVINYAAWSSTMINYTPISGGTSQHRRYGVSLPLNAATQYNLSGLIQKLRISNNLLIRPGIDGLIEFQAKQGLADQQPSPVSGSNYNTGIPSFKATDDPTLASGTGTGYVAYSFSERDIIPGSLQITQNRISESPNLIKVQISDEDYDYISDSVEIGDPVDSQRVQQSVNGTIDLIGVPNADQGLRVGETYMAELYRGNERVDSGGGGTITVEFQTSSRVVHLRTGDIVWFSDYQHEINQQTFRVISRTPGMNGQFWTLKLQWHEDWWYCDQYGQKNPYFRQAFGDTAGRKNPYGWQPNHVTGLATDPLYANYSTFGILRGGDVQPSGVNIPAIELLGESPVNIPGNVPAPLMQRFATVLTTGGTLPGNTIYYIACSSLDSTGAEGPLGRIQAQCFAPPGTNTNLIEISILDYPVQAVGIRVYLGPRSDFLTKVVDIPDGLPQTIAIPSLVESGRAPIDVLASNLLCRAKRVTIPGAALFGVNIDPRSGTQTILNVTNTAISFSSTWNIYTNQYETIPVGNNARTAVNASLPSIPDHTFDGYYMMAVGVADDSEIPFGVFKISTQIGNTLNIDQSFGATTLSVAEYQYSYFLILHKITAASGTSITLAGITNTIATAAVGYHVHVLEGAGATNAPRLIVAIDGSNNLIVDRDWDEPLDTTSVIIIEEASWRYTANAAISCSQPGVQINPVVDVANIGGGLYYVEGVVQSKLGTTPVSPNDNPYRLFWWAGDISPATLFNSGQNLLSNPNFEVPATLSTDDVLAGWHIDLNDLNAWQPVYYTGGSVYSGLNSLQMHLKPGIVVPNGASVQCHYASDTKFQVRPGETYYMSAYTRMDYRQGQPGSVGTQSSTTLLCRRWMFLYVTYADGSHDSLFGTAEIFVASGWTKVWGRVQIAANRGTPLNMQAMLFIDIQNNTGADYTTQGPLEFDGYFDGVVLYRVTDANTSVSGSLLPSQSLPVNVTQNSNSGGSCTVGLSWSATSIPLSNGSSVSVTSGSAQWTGLSAATSYYFYYYANLLDGSIHFGSGDSPSTPPTAPDPASSLACYSDGRQPMGILIVTTPATSGASGSSSGSSSTCPEANETVYVQGKGVIPCVQVQPSDWIRGRNVRTNDVVFRRVVKVGMFPSSTWRMVNGCRVSPVHPVWSDGQWKFPYQLSSTVDTTPGTRVQITLDTAIFDEQNFALVDADGNDVLVMHNVLISS